MPDNQQLVGKLPSESLPNQFQHNYSGLCVVWRFAELVSGIDFSDRLNFVRRADFADQYYAGLHKSPVVEQHFSDRTNSIATPRAA
jgi:hypothetical protein